MVLVLVSCCWVGLGCSDDDTSSDAGPDASASDGSADSPGQDAGVMTLSGMIVQYTDDDPLPVQGATVSILDASPAVQVVTEADGTFELDAPEGAGVVFLLAEKEGLIGGLRGVTVYSSGVSDIEIGMLLPSMVEGILAALNLPDWDGAKGILSVEFSFETGGGAAGNEKAEINAANDGSFAFDSEGAPQLRETLLAGEDSEELIFANVTPGSVTLDLTAGGCGPVLGETQTYPVRANVMTAVDINCFKD
jgi:hypothetical protein